MSVLVYISDIAWILFVKKYLYYYWLYNIVTTTKGKRPETPMRGNYDQWECHTKELMKKLIFGTIARSKSVKFFIFSSDDL